MFSRYKSRSDPIFGQNFEKNNNHNFKHYFLAKSVIYSFSVFAKKTNFILSYLILTNFGLEQRYSLAKKTYTAHTH